jgi:5-hydroxyisourate hydrolase-like protein (transthyretin family)
VGGQTYVADATLARTGGGRVTGRLVDDRTGDPVAGACVQLYEQNVQPIAAGFATTDAEGRFRFQGLNTSSYVLDIEGLMCAGYLHEAYEDEPDLASADPIAVTLGSGTDLGDVRVTRAGSISGRVTDAATGAPLDGICVNVDRADNGEFVTATDTNANGRYTASGLTEGLYIVRFFDCGDDVYRDEAFDEALDSAFATPVRVTPPATTRVDEDLVRESG